jgi:hypothetical protein
VLPPARYCAVVRRHCWPSASTHMENPLPPLPQAVAVVDLSRPSATGPFLAWLRAHARPTPTPDAGIAPLAPAVRERFLFGTLDGDEFGAFARQFNVYPQQMPRLVVLDVERDRFYEEVCAPLTAL